jgi:tyrosyl-tRNA synthetase
MINAEIVKRNVVETVTEEELDRLLDVGKPTVYCGYETSGKVHIGHMVTATKLSDMQGQSLKVKVLFADIHTRLNKKGKDSWIDDMVEYWRHCFNAMGLDKAEYILGSDFQMEKPYLEDVFRLAGETTMNRALRSMQEVARDIENAKVSQMIYPLMQIADIKALNTDIAYGGMEQRKIHMLARETLPLISAKKPVCLHTPLICSLKGPDCKMSSSQPETIIAIDEEPDSISKKIKSAYCPPDAEKNPILDALRLIVFPREGILTVKRAQKYGGDLEYTQYQRLEEDYILKKLHPADLKTASSEALIKTLEPIREYMKENRVKYPKN